MLWHHVWTAVLAANLAVPVMMAKGMTGPGGEVGMAMAVGLLWLIDDLIGVRSRSARFVLTWGGIVVALSQFFPLLQVFAGAFGIGLAEAFVPIDRDAELGIVRNLSGPAAFLVTLVTGGILLFATSIAGVLIQARFRGSRSPAPSIKRRLH